MIVEAILKLINKEDLSYQETREVFEEIFNGQATEAQISAFLVALSIKKETHDEIKSAVDFIKEKAIKLEVRDIFMGVQTQEPIIDTCGTGGSGIYKFNISTATAFIIASAGIKVAKHGNRSMSSLCGSADVLEALGVKIDIPIKIMQEAIKKIGIGFLYAPLYHPVLRSISSIRRQIRLKTIFNIIGPLCNPVDITHQILGVYRQDLVKILSKVLLSLKRKGAFVFYSEDLKDEISLYKKTIVSFLHNKKIENFYLTAKDFGLKKTKSDEILISSASDSARIIKEILSNRKIPARNFVLASSSACFYILGKVKSLKEGVSLTESLLKEGKPLKKLDELINFINSYKE